MKSSRGFSLIELAVVLAIVGAMGLAGLRLIPEALNVGGGQASSVDLRRAQSAIEGFALGRLRLACPDTSGDGYEDCNAGSTGVGDGLLPWRSLGLDDPEVRIRYAAYQSSARDLTAERTADDYAPYLPIDSGATQNTLNGLDFCAELMGIMGASGLTVGTGSQSTVAVYALAHPGDNGRFQGLNAGSGFTLPGQRGDSDDVVIAAGPTEFATRLGCSQRLAKVNGSAAAAYAAHDLERTANLYVEFRDLALFARRGNVESAIVGVSLASVNLANTIGAQAVSISGATSSKGATAFAVGMAIATVSIAISNLVQAGIGLAGAEAAVPVAEGNLSNAQTFHDEVEDESQRRLDEANVENRRGVLP